MERDDELEASTTGHEWGGIHRAVRCASTWGRWERERARIPPPLQQRSHSRRRRGTRARDGRTFGFSAPLDTRISAYNLGLPTIT